MEHHSGNEWRYGKTRWRLDMNSHDVKPIGNVPDEVWAEIYGRKRAEAAAMLAGEFAKLTAVGFVESGGTSMLFRYKSSDDHVVVTCKVHCVLYRPLNRAYGDDALVKWSAKYKKHDKTTGPSVDNVFSQWSAALQEYYYPGMQYSVDTWRPFGTTSMKRCGDRWICGRREWKMDLDDGDLIAIRSKHDDKSYALLRRTKYKEAKKLLRAETAELKRLGFRQKGYHSATLPSTLRLHFYSRGQHTLIECEVSCVFYRALSHDCLDHLFVKWHTHIVDDQFGPFNNITDMIKAWPDYLRRYHGVTI